MVIDNPSDWVKPIYLTDHDIDVMDRQTKKDIMAQNKAWQANCQKDKADLKKHIDKTSAERQCSSNERGHAPVKQCGSQTRTGYKRL
ncbi:hypothetical protein [Enterobacter asburiae]|uniref:hypothetical protein n=1 Tax=Enterobacter asburiae TaxID=61645 RepID=UPI0019370B70|nr:hypothetical protein [Enterobacter asburiae]QQE41469.1 hypothetical protein I6I13_12275 [Enterobacter asburiae]